MKLIIKTPITWAPACRNAKLIDRDQVDVIFGDVNSGIAYAMAQLSEKKVLHIVPGGHTDPITGTNCKWNVFRVCNTTTMDAEAVTPQLVQKFGKRWTSSRPITPTAVR